MPIAYPSNPSDGDTFTHGGVTYVYDATPGYWKGTVPSVTTDVSQLTDTTSLLFDGAFNSLTGTPTTLSGYGITDGGGGGLGGSSSGPTTAGSGSSVTVTTAGLYYFNGFHSGGATATVSGNTISGMIWATEYVSGYTSKMSIGFITSAGNSMSASVGQGGVTHGFTGWVKTSGSVTFGGTASYSGIYKVD